MEEAHGKPRLSVLWLARAINKTLDARTVLICDAIWAGFVALYIAAAWIDGRDSKWNASFEEKLLIYCTGFAPWLVLLPLLFSSAKALASAPFPVRHKQIACALLILCACMVVLLWNTFLFGPLQGMTPLEFLARVSLVSFTWDAVLLVTALLAGFAATPRLHRQSAAGPERIAVRAGKRTDYVRGEDILAVSAQANYLDLICEASTHLHRQTLAEFLETHEGGDFIRVHRSHALRLDAVNSLSRKTNGGYVATLTNGHEIPVSRSYERDLRARLAARDIPVQRIP